MFDACLIAVGQSTYGEAVRMNLVEDLPGNVGYQISMNSFSVSGLVNALLSAS